MPTKVRTRKPNALGLIPRGRLAAEVANILDRRGITQTEASYIIRDAPSQISLIVGGKVKGFSAERLLRILTRLGRDVDIVIRKSKGKTGRVQLAIR